MGDYNAEKDPDILRAQVIARNYFGIPHEKLLMDEWNINEHHRVNNFANGTGNIKFKVKTDPTDIHIQG